MDERACIVHDFIRTHRRSIATTLRDTRDDDTVYALIASLAPSAAVVSVDARIECLTLEAVMGRHGTERTGVRWCLDQMSSLKATSHRTSDVVVGVDFGDDLLTFIARVAAT